jgi:hypothetical protein
MPVDGVEDRAWLAGLGCGPSVSKRAWEGVMEQAWEDWERAANLALAGANQCRRQRTVPKPQCV